MSSSNSPPAISNLSFNKVRRSIESFPNKKLNLENGGISYAVNQYMSALEKLRNCCKYLGQQVNVQIEGLEAETQVLFYLCAQSPERKLDEASYEPLEEEKEHEVTPKAPQRSVTPQELQKPISEPAASRSSEVPLLHNSKINPVWFPGKETRQAYRKTLKK